MASIIPTPLLHIKVGEWGCLASGLSSKTNLLKHRVKNLLLFQLPGVRHIAVSKAFSYKPQERKKIQGTAELAVGKRCLESRGSNGRESG